MCHAHPFIRHSHRDHTGKHDVHATELVSCNLGRGHPPSRVLSLRDGNENLPTKSISRLREMVQAGVLVHPRSDGTPSVPTNLRCPIHLLLAILANDNYYTVQEDVWRHVAIYSFHFPAITRKKNDNGNTRYIIVPRQSPIAFSVNLYADQFII